MKRVLSFILVFTLLTGFCSFCTVGTQDTEEAEFPFGDVPASRWSNPYVVLMYNNGIVEGKSANVFAPADSIKRSEFVKILCGVAGADTEGAEHSFTDVVSGSWYEPYVAWAAEQGIVDGVAPNVFAPDAPITRQDMAVMIYRYVDNVLYPDASDEEPSPSEPTDPDEPAEPDGLPQINEPVTFTDDAQIADYAKEVVSTMQQAGIIGGVKNDDGSYRFEPKSNSTREQACKMLGELYLIINEDKELPEAVAPPVYKVRYALVRDPYTPYRLEDGEKWVNSYDTTEDFVLPSLKRTAYDFLGWSGPGINGIAVHPVIKAGSVAGDLTYTPHWKPIEYKIVYDLDGGRFEEEVLTSYTIGTSYTLPCPVREGYVFVGWYKSFSSALYSSHASITPYMYGWVKYTAYWVPRNEASDAYDELLSWAMQTQKSGKYPSDLDYDEDNFIVSTVVNGAPAELKVTPYERYIGFRLKWVEEGRTHYTFVKLSVHPYNRIYMSYSVCEPGHNAGARIALYFNGTTWRTEYEPQVYVDWRFEDYPNDELIETAKKNCRETTVPMIQEYIDGAFEEMGAPYDHKIFG